MSIQAIADGIAAKPHPSAHPGQHLSISDDNEWESYATPARDARLRPPLSNSITTWRR